MIIQPSNPTKEQRYAMIKDALKAVFREEDFESIIKLSKPPIDILNIAPPMSFNQLKVGVIGGGVAGLSAAFELRKLGFDVTILEANPNRIGGRIFTHYFDKHHHGELGAMRIPASHETTWHYIDLFKLKTNPFFVNSDNNIYYIKNERIRGMNIDQKIQSQIYPKFNLTEFEKGIPPSRIMEYLYSNFIQRLPISIREEFYQIKPNYSYPIYYYDTLFFRELMHNIGFSEGLISLLYSLLGIDRNLYYFNFLELLKENYSVNYAYMYEINNGLINLPYAFLNSFKVQRPDLGTVRFMQGAHVYEVSYSNNKVYLRYALHMTNTFFVDEFDYVVCAIPFSKLRVLNVKPGFTNQKVQAIAELNYVPAQKTIFFTKERFWEKISGKTSFGGGSITDLPINTSWYPSNIINPNDPRGVILASYNLNLDSTRIGNLDKVSGLYIVKRELEEVHGLPYGYLDNILLDYKSINWNNEEFALGGFRWDRPGQNMLFSYAAVMPEFDYHMFFAGEHISQYHSWLQGALQSGMYAANSIAEVAKSRSANR